MIPSMRVPEHLPLENGRITCVTCHEVPARGPSHLRETGVDLCAACHQPRSGHVRDVHALATTRAHLVSDDDTARFETDWSFGPDPESAQCLACHDGALARRGDVVLGRNTGSQAMRLFGGQHPIGVEQAPRGIGDTLRPAHLVDPAIRLFDGRVGCGSCHDPYAGNDMMLSIPNDGSRLCLECHDF
ncbi:MAG: cytochrome c3 family protein [Planctomycetota bacterium]